MEPVMSTDTGPSVWIDKTSPEYHLIGIANGIKQCQDGLIELLPMINEIEGEHERVSSTLAFIPPTRFVLQPKNHDQAITQYNKLMMELDTLHHRARSHPIQRLPLELLEHIFHLLLESADENGASAWYEAFPLNLTQVCSQWEALILSISNRRLWSMIRIDPADPDWSEQLHLHLFLSRNESLSILVTEMTQAIVDELAGHYQRIRSFLPGELMHQVSDTDISEQNITQFTIRDQYNRCFSMPLPTSVAALPFALISQASLHRLQEFHQLRMLYISTLKLQLEDIGGPLHWPALQRLHLQVIQENPLDFLRLFAPSQLLDLQLELPKPPSPVGYLELETFIVEQMPNLRWVVLIVSGYTEEKIPQPVGQPTTQSSSAKQSESLRRIDCNALVRKNPMPPFERLIGKAPHLEECHLTVPIKSFPVFSHCTRRLELNFYGSPISPSMNLGMFRFLHLEVLKLTFNTSGQLQFLKVFQAPSLLSLEVSPGKGYDLQDHLIPLDAVSTFLSTSLGIHNLVLHFRVDEITLSLFELRNLEIKYTSHFSVLSSLDMPKLQRLFLEIDDGSGEGEYTEEEEDLAENENDVSSPLLSSQAASRPGVLGVVEATPILEEDERRATSNSPKGIDPRGAPFDPIMTSAPTFPTIIFEHLKDFEFEVSTPGSYPIKVLSYFPDMLAALPALERITLPVVHFNNSPYIDQLVEKISGIPILCHNLQQIRSRDYPNDWSNFLRFLRNRKRASMLSDPTLRPIHALHFPITPHGSIVRQLQDAMLGKISTEAFPALCPWPMLIDSGLEEWKHGGFSMEEDADEETRPQVQEDERSAADVPVQAQEEDAMGKSEKEKQAEEECASEEDEDEDEALPCFLCHKAGLGAGCRRVFWREGILSRLEVSSGDVRCSRWDKALESHSRLEAIPLP
jgi:hypothetical protein